MVAECFIKRLFSRFCKKCRIHFGRNIALNLFENVADTLIGCSEAFGFRQFQEAAHGGKQAVLCGDFNIAHTPLDIKNAKANEKHAGFLPEERAYVDKWLGELEFVDVMRSLCGDIQGPYTWWSQRGRAFDNNVGWRIDYQFATPELAETARGFVIDKAPTYDLRWSDHAPLSITYDV